MRVRFTPQARDDLDGIFSYISERNPSAARDVKSAIVQTCRGLAGLPHLGHPTDRRPDLFIVLVADYPAYKVFYRVLENAVSIEHIRDARRRPID